MFFRRLVTAGSAAYDAILANRLRAGLTTLGVLIGVLTMILLMTLGEAVRVYLGETFAGMGVNLLQVFPGKRDARGFSNLPISTARRLTQEDALAVQRRVYAVGALCGIVNGSGTVRYLDRRRDTVVVGVSERFPEIRRTQIAQGRFLSAEDLLARRRVVVLGYRLVAELFGTQPAVGQALRIANAEFHVVGTLPKRGVTLGFDLDDQVFIPTTTAQEVFAQEGLNSFLLTARDRKSVEAAIEGITEVLKQRHGGQVDFSIVTQDDMLQTVDKVSRTFTLVLVAIASISLLVGGIGIANILLVSVQERIREIGVRRSVGAKRRDILVQFLLEAAFLGLLGGVVGVMLAQGLLLGLARLAPELPLNLSLGTALLALGFSVSVGLLAGVWPARRAALLDPVEALRHDG